MLRPLSYTLLLILIVLPMMPSGQADEPQSRSFLTRIWDLSGCQLDPNGKCIPSPRPTADIDNGCEFDPGGRCRN